MAAMTMNYAVARPKLQHLRPGTQVRFTIDAGQRAIVDIVPVTK